MLVEQALAAWKDEGGTAQSNSVDAGQSPSRKQKLAGTINQVDWAEQIRTRVNAEFDRVAKALELASSKRAEQDRSEIQVMIAILEEKRAEVMANDRAGYFIHDWQELHGRVRDMITADPRYRAMKASKALRKQ
jgi:cell division FtsZ-interacting protein ZapD